MRESMREVWKCVWGKCGGCGKARESVLGYEVVWKSVGGGVGKCEGSPHTLLHLPYTSLHTLHIHPTPLPPPPHSPNTSPSHTPHSPDTSLHTFPHSLHTFPHSLHTSPHPSHLSSPLPHTYLKPSSHLPQHSLTLTPRTSSQPPHLLQHFPILLHTLSFTPYQNFSLFSFCSQI